MKNWYAGLALVTAVVACQGSQPAGDSLVGKRAASAALKSSTGATVDPGSRFGKQPVVLVFYRGQW